MDAATLGSVGAAAKNSVGQPAVSQGIKKIGFFKGGTTRSQQESLGLTIQESLFLALG